MMPAYAHSLSQAAMESFIVVPHLVHFLIIYSLSSSDTSAGPKLQYLSSYRTETQYLDGCSQWLITIKLLQCTEKKQREMLKNVLVVESELCCIEFKLEH